MKCSNINGKTHTSICLYFNCFKYELLTDSFYKQVIESHEFKYGHKPFSQIKKKSAIIR
jgi:hypothetical protein